MKDFFLHKKWKKKKIHIHNYISVCLCNRNLCSPTWSWSQVLLFYMDIRCKIPCFKMTRHWHVCKIILLKTFIYLTMLQLFTSQPYTNLRIRCGFSFLEKMSILVSRLLACLHVCANVRVWGPFLKFKSMVPFSD